MLASQQFMPPVQSPFVAGKTTGRPVLDTSDGQKAVQELTRLFSSAPRMVTCVLHPNTSSLLIDSDRK
jgi:hypothetical protein